MANVLQLSNSVGQEITVDQVRNFLNANKGQDVQFDIETLGGDLATGITIHNLIKAHSGKTTANIIGLTASAGTVIAIACDEVVMSDNALFLIHNGWREMTGNVYDFKKAAEDLAKTDAIMIKMYREKTGMNPNAISDLMKASDWMSPDEALSYGFIDRIETSGVKIAASVLISEAQGKINQLLLTKLEDKMKIFGKTKAEATPEVFNILALKDNRTMLINAEEVAQGVEIAAPLGATLEDGEYELADGRKIMVAGGVVTEVMEMTPDEPAASADVVGVVAEILAKFKAEIEAQIEPLKTLASTHKPPKATGPVNAGQASVEDRMLNSIEAKMAEIKAAAAKRRKGE